MNINQLKYIVELSRTGSFTRAAKNLYISQPTLSQQVQLLEKELKVELFVKDRRRITAVTPAGQEILHHAEEILSHVQQLETAANKFSQKSYEEIRLGLLWTFAAVRIDKLLNEFRREHPYVTIKLKVDGSNNLYRDLMEGQLDLIFSLEPPQTSGRGASLLHNLAMERMDQKADLLSESPILAVMSACHRLAERKYIGAADLYGSDVLMVSRDSSLYTLLQQHFKDADIVPSVIGESSQADTIIKIAEADMGVGFLSKETFQVYQNQEVVGIPLLPVIKRKVFLIKSPVPKYIQATDQLRTFILKNFRRV